MSLPNIIEDIETIKSTYFPLGNKKIVFTATAATEIFKNNTTSAIGLRGGTTTNNGGWLALRGDENSKNPGTFELKAVSSIDGTSSSLLGKPDGTLTWGGANVITSAGGTMTGKLYYNASHIICNKTGGEIRLVADDENVTVGRTSLILFEKGNSSYPGWFYLRSGDDSTYCDLRGKPDGTLTWNNKNVVCVTAWINGNNWYRKYSDGWIEQGGQIGRQVTVTTNFNIAFTQIPTCICGCVYNRASTFYAREVYPNTVSTTAFTITNTVPAGSTSDYIKWYACGY